MDLNRHPFRQWKRVDFPHKVVNSKISSFLLITALLTLVIIILNGLFFLERLKELEEQKQSIIHILARSSTNSEKTFQFPRIDNLPIVIEGCAQIFANENIELRSFNLERFGRGNYDSPGLNYAHIRMKVRGSWDGIQRGLAIVESLPDQIIITDELELQGNGGEILLRIYFEEPNNPQLP